MKVTLLNSLGGSSKHQKLNLYASHVAWIMSGVDGCGGSVGVAAVVFVLYSMHSLAIRLLQL